MAAPLGGDRHAQAGEAAADDEHIRVDDVHLLSPSVAGAAGGVMTRAAPGWAGSEERCQLGTNSLPMRASRPMPILM